MVKQVPKIEIHDEQARIVKGWGTVDIFDKANERLPIEEFKRIMPIIMKRGGIVMNCHTNQPAGKILNYQFLMKDTPDGPKEGVYLETEVYKDFGSDDEVWKAIKKGEIEGFSFGGKSNLEDVDFSEGVSKKTLKGLEGFEFSYVPTGCNQEATIEEINFIAKQDVSKEDGETSLESEHYHLYRIDEQGNGATLGTLPREVEDHKHEIKAGVVQTENGHEHRLVRKLVDKEEVKKPFAGFEDFDACVRANQDKDDPAAFCGFLQARVEKIEQEYDDEEKNKRQKTNHTDDKTLSKSVSTLKEFTKKCESFIKNNDVTKDMAEEEEKESDTKKVEEAPQAADSEAPTEDPMARVEAKLDKLIEVITNSQKVEEPEEEKPEEEPKEKPEEEEEVEKEGDGEKVKLPETEGEEISQSPPAEGEETDEAGANFLEKEGIEKIKADVKADIMKELKIVKNPKADTPRAGIKTNEIQKADTPDKPKNWVEANKLIKKMGLN